MSRFPTYREPYSRTEREIERLLVNEQFQDNHRPQYLERGEATFLPPETNALQNLFLKPARRQFESSGLGTAASTTGFSFFSSQFFPKGDNDIPLNISGDNAIFRDGTIKPVSDLSGTDYWDALDPHVQHVLSNKGVSKDQFRDIENKFEADERYNNIAHSIELDQKAQRFNEIRPSWASATGLAGFALDVITDPINLITFGTGSLVKSTATQGVSTGIRASTTALAKTATRDGMPFASVFSQASRASDDLAGHLLTSLQSSKYVTREVVDIDGRVMKVTFEVIEDLGDTRRLRPISVSKEGLAKFKPKALPAGPGKDLVPVTVSPLDDATELVVRSTSDLANVPGKGLVRIGSILDDKIPDVRRMKTVRNTAGEGLVVIPKSMVAGVPSTTKTTAASLVQEATQTSARLSKTQAAMLGIAEATIYDTVTQYAEYKHRVDNLGIDEEFSYNYLNGAMSATLGGSLSALGASLAGRSPSPITNNSLIQDHPSSLVGRRAENKVRKGTAARDAQVDLIEMDAMHRVQAWSKAAYSSTQYRQIMDAVEPLDAPFYDSLGEFFSSAPTFNEAMAFIKGEKTDTSTELSSLLRTIRDRSQKIRDLKVNGESPELKTLRRRQKTDEDRYRELVSRFEFREDKEGYKFRRITEDLPFLDIYHNKTDRMSRMRDLVAGTMDNLPDSTQGQISKATHGIFKYLAKLGSQGTAARQYQKIEDIDSNPIAQVMARMFGAYDPRISNDFFTYSDGTSVTSIHDNIAAFAIKHSGFSNPYARIMRGKTEADRLAIGYEVLSARVGSREVSDLSQEAKELLPLYSKFFDESGRQGVRNGSLRGIIDDYTPFLLKEGLGNTVKNNLSSMYAKWLKDTQFGDDFTELHRNTMYRLKILDDNGNLVKDSPYEEIPVNKSDLLPEDLERYLEDLDASLNEEARDAITRRFGRKQGTPEDPVVRDEGRKIMFRTDNRASRAIEAKFWMSEDVRKLDVLDTDILKITQNYRDTMGAVIARQETLTEIFGEAARADDFFEHINTLIRNMDNTDPHKVILSDALEALRTMDKHTTGFRTREATGLEKIAVPMKDLTSATINQAIVIAMSPEMVTSVIPRLFNARDIRLFGKHLKEMLSFGLINDDMRAFAYASEVEGGSGRYFGVDAIDPGSHVGKGFRSWRDFSRQWFGEAAVTKRLKRFRYLSDYGRTARKLYKVVDRLDELLVNIDPNDPRSIKDAARKAGFGSDAALARDYRRLGLHTKDAQRAVKRFMEVNEEALYNPEQAAQVAMRESDESLRSAMMDLADRIGILARESTDRVIVTRSAGTALKDNDALGALVLQFLTHPAGWFNATLRRYSQGPNSAFAAYLGMYLMGEATAAAIREVVFKGGTPETVITDWEENFVEKMANVSLRIPMAGPWSSWAVSPLTSLVTGQKGHLGLSSNPAFSFAESTVNGTVTSARKVFKGEEITDQNLRNMVRQFPLLGSPLGQTLIRSGEE